MRFEDFITSKKVRRGNPDIQLAKSLVKMSDNHLKSIEYMKLTETSSATIMTNYYESLREVVEAIAAIDGYKVYSHEAFTHFLREKGEDIISIKFDNYRKIRNSVNYYGKTVEVGITAANTEEIKRMIYQLKEKYLKRILG
ncbi:MAG: hypothetical protein JXC85_06345 [Candidatus Aenigmarchaeota archaeon]|nr:hypothetical protein [Candidatus Aenigmarchaeota archaeon]